MKRASRARRVFDWILGVSLLLLGVAGLVLPGLQGILLILAGLAVLSSHSPLARRIQDAWKLRLQMVRDRVVKRR